MSRSSGETLVVRSTKSYYAKHEILLCEARNLIMRSTKSYYPKIKQGVSPVGRPAYLGAQLIQLDRSRSRTCTEPSAHNSPSGRNNNICYFNREVSFARWAPSLFSWTEAGHGPAPSLRLITASLFSWTEAGHGPAPSLRLITALRAETITFAVSIEKSVSPVGRPACSAGPK